MILSALESDDGGGDYESEFTYYMPIFESDISVTDTGGGAYETISTTNASTATSSSSLRRTSRQHGQIAIGGYERNPFFGGDPPYSGAKGYTRAITKVRRFAILTREISPLKPPPI